jgi:murein DD-endopeptidase MepM/ murein hydrolase activator NlpD
VSITGIQGRMAQIQAMLATAVPPSPTTATTAAATTGAPSFAAVLQQAVGANAPAASGSGWASPASGEITSGFGPRWGTEHEGIDIGAAAGAPVRAAADGVVRKASWYGGYGNAVIIDHGDGVSTLYGHNSELSVKPGERVQAGQTIAKVGSTGDSTGPHLHFEVEVDGRKVDPAPWLRKRGVTL